MTSISHQRAPAVWAVVLGWNHAEDSIACLQSLAASRNVQLTLLYVDNGSTPDQVQQVFNAVPSAQIIRHSANVGIPRGFDAGLFYALSHGADYVFMANNDTTVDEHCLERLVAAGEADSSIGLLMPNIYYDNERDLIWSAGSRFRLLPPAIVMRQSRVPGDPRFQHDQEIDFSSFCTALLRGEALRKAGFLDPDYSFYHQDYDLSLRIRLAGFKLWLVAAARSWHKVERLTRPGKSRPEFWLHYAQSEAVFCRKHARFRWLTGPVHRWYLQVRALYEGGWTAFRYFTRGLREGRRIVLHSPPRMEDGPLDRVDVLRAG